jgi:hypothetical protein
VPSLCEKSGSAEESWGKEVRVADQEEIRHHTNESFASFLTFFQADSLKGGDGMRIKRECVSPGATEIRASFRGFAEQARTFVSFASHTLPLAVAQQMLEMRGSGGWFGGWQRRRVQGPPPTLREGPTIREQ